jgi:hypothetical protein
VPVALRVFTAAQRRLGAPARSPGDARDLEAAAAEAGEVAGWLLYDADRQPQARAANTEALLIAQQAGDRSIELLLYAAMAMQSVYLNRPREALRIADGLLDTDQLSGRVAAVFHIRRGRALAQLGDRSGLDDLQRAAALLADGPRAGDPPWTWWVETSELTWHQAMCQVSLGNHTRAVELFQRTLELRPAGTRRARYNDLAHLLEALVRVEAWRDADEMAGLLLPLAGQVGSGRTTHLLQRVAHHATRAGRDVPAVAQLGTLLECLR